MSSKPIMKAMILAAGKGERLRPLTETTPKPLIKAGKQALIEHQIFQLKKLGITQVVINVCYLAKKIIESLGNGERYGVTLDYSFEPSSLGTGGGIKQALTFLGDAPFLLIAADVWSDFAFPDSFLFSNSQLHMLFVDNPPFHPNGDFGLSDEGNLTKEGPKLTYAGIAKIDPALFSLIDEKTFSFSRLIDQAIEAGSATGERFSGAWFNVGTQKQLNALQDYLASLPSTE